MEDKKVFDQIMSCFVSFTKTQKRIANYICENYTHIPAMSVQELAEKLDTSDATIIRFAQALGFKGYLEMRSALKMESQHYWSPYAQFNRKTSLPSPHSDKRPKNAIEAIAHNDISCHQEFYETFDRSVLSDIVKDINKAQTIHIAGFGIDSTIAIFLDWYLSMMGYPTRCYTDDGLSTARRFNNAKKDDLLIMLITPRHLKTEKSVLQEARRKGLRITCIAQGITLDMSSLCDITVSLPDTANELINSYVTYMSLCNMLIMAVYESNKDAISHNLRSSESILKSFDLLL